MNDAGNLPTSLVAVLNGGDLHVLTSSCAPGVTVFAPIAEETIDPFARRDPGRIGEFVAAYHRAMPDIRFGLVGSVRNGDSLTVRWNARGTHRQALGYIAPSGNAVTIEGTCVFRFTANQITEVRLAADIYGFLLQTGALCADPGVARGRAPAIAAAAMAALRDAVAQRVTTVGAPFDDGTKLHANVSYYASAALEQATFDLHGAGAMPRLLGELRDRFASAEFTFDAGVSQGHTTTFRGHARVERDGERYCYKLRCGFRTKGERIAESWFEVLVPPTLHEVFA